MWARRYGNLSGALLRDSALDSSHLGMAPGTAEVKTDTTSSISARLGQVRFPSIFTWDVDRMVIFKNRISQLEWKSNVVEGLQPQRLRQNVYIAPSFRRGTKGYLMVGWGPCTKSRGLYGCDKVVGRTHLRLKGTIFTGFGPIWRHSCPSMVRVVVMLLRQHDDQLKIGLP